MQGITIVGTGRMLPSKCVTNDDLAKVVDTSDEWIKSRTGIETRYFCDEEKNLELAAGAAKKAIQNAGIDKSEIGACIVATFTPDYATPSVSCMVQKELGLNKDIPVFDINAACSGFLYGLNIGACMINTLNHPYVLVIGSEQISSRLDMTDRGTCVLFGDGAGAAVIKSSDRNNFTCVLGASGDEEALGCEGHTSSHPYIYMDGQKVFRFAVSTIVNVINELLQKSGMTMDDIDYVVCHQANERIIRHVIKQMKSSENKFYMNLQRYGNTSAASIPMVIDEMNEKNMLTAGKKMLCVGFGAGFTWGGAIIEL